MAKSTFLFFSLALLQACSVSYSTTQTNIPAEAEAIGITMFYSTANQGTADLERNFTEDLRDYFQRNTKLEVNTEPVDGQLMLEGAITDFDIQQQAPQEENGVQTAALSRLKITVKAKFTNPFDEKTNFDKSFSFFKDYPSDQTLNEVSSTLIPEITEQIILKIFTASFDNW